MRRSVLWVLGALSFSFSFSCAERGGGTRVVAVTTQGGVLTSADGLFSLEIPEGALASKTSVSITMRGEDFKPADLSSRAYEVSPLELVPGATVKVHYRAPRTPWVGQRTIATFDDDRTEPAWEADYDHFDHVATAVYRSFERRLFGLATLVETANVRPCSAGCTRGRPGCLTDPEVFAANHCEADEWDEPPNTGLLFVLDQIQIAPAGRGFNVDRRCKAIGDCLDNALAQLGAYTNDQIRQALLGGETLLLLELAGLDHPGDLVADTALTVKLYEGRDFDVPFFPANNFQAPAGFTRCCEFLIDAGSLEGSPATARARIPAALEAGAVKSLAPGDVGLWGALPVLGMFWAETSTGAPQGALRNAQISLNLEANDRGDVVRVVDGLLGGVILARELALSPGYGCGSFNAACPSPDMRVLESIYKSLGPPDVDVAQDGFEVFHTSPEGLIVECLDGDGSAIPPVDPARPASCAESERVDDAYSVAYTFSAIAAKVKGVWPGR